jgi:hypothetical protein
MMQRTALCLIVVGRGSGREIAKALVSDGGLGMPTASAQEGGMRYFGVLGSVAFWEIQRVSSERESLPGFAWALRVWRLTSGTPVVTVTDLRLTR